MPDIDTIRPREISDIDNIAHAPFSPNNHGAHIHIETTPNVANKIAA
jgi:hypothetical protein